MRRDAFDDLVAITDAVFQSDLARLRAIAGEEAELRAELEELAQAESRNAAADPDSIAALNRIGGDILWRAWIGRKRETLNLKLATVLARKLVAAQALRRSFGKMSVADGLHGRVAAKSKADRATRLLEADQAGMILKAAASADRR